MKKVFLLLATMLTVVAGCSSSTEKGEISDGRKQLLLVPSEQITQLSAEGYEKVKSEASAAGTLDKNPQQLARLQTIANRLVPHTEQFRKDAPAWKWEVHVISSDQLNAFCMPGGKIMFYSGIIDKLNLTDAEIAAIMGHEIAHALREHGRERMSEELVKSLGLNLLVATNKLDAKYAGAANMLTALTISLPHGRKQETEADVMGLELMARAGYDPNAAVNLWKKMGAAGGAKPPEILSSHPSDSTRIKTLEGLVPKSLPIYQRSAKAPDARRAG